MPSDRILVLYTDDEPGYKSTKLDSGVLPPSLSTLPRIVKAPRGGGSNVVSIQGQANRNARQLPQHSHQPYPQRTDKPNEPIAPVPPRPTVDVVGRFFVVIENKRAANFVEQLSTPEWSRMMSERDDVRGRRTDTRLLRDDAGLIQNLERQKETLIKAAMPTREFNAVCALNNPYAALARCSTLSNLSAIALGHLDFLLKPVQEYLKAEAGMQFVDLGSKDGGFSRYILWRSSQLKTGNGGAKGWYFGRGDAAAVKQSPATADSGYGLDIERLSLDCSGAADSLTEFGADSKTKPDILDPATVEAFIEFVKGNSTNTVGVDLVVGECGGGDDLPDFGTDLERRQYAFILAQAVIALRVLRKDGTFVFKMADTTTPLSAEILFLLHSCFERMAIVRSLASRPTSSERYIVCNHLKGEPRWIASHLLAALTRIHADQFKLSHLVSWTRVSADKEFIDKISSVNVTLARTQMSALKHAIEQRSSPNNADSRPSKFQIDVAERCLKTWGLPVKPMH
ncbi:hypothetical protein FBU31_002557 [Coemansia sp. 'formosensis']|nr:hypothetical protein FBU31_002557 [Coemansia sp. 'formosensis']